MDMVQQTIVWAAFCLVALGLALWRPGAGRLALGIFFIIMAVGVNVVFVLAAPDGFVDLGTSAAAAFPLGMGLRTCGRQSPRGLRPARRQL